MNTTEHTNGQQKNNTKNMNMIEQDSFKFCNI